MKKSALVIILTSFLISCASTKDTAVSTNPPTKEENSTSISPEQPKMQKSPADNQVRYDR
ncbi:MAG TPA: hypothetical protein PL009_07180 [Flavipsychrobacter sp.]|nr:hypothetical protein [Flavipsychrobacter sp.]